MKNTGKILAVTVAIVILLIACFYFFEKSNNNVREEAKATAEQFADAYFSVLFGAMCIVMLLLGGAVDIKTGETIYRTDSIPIDFGIRSMNQGRI